jgi:hypothetical protein
MKYAPVGSQEEKEKMSENPGQKKAVEFSGKKRVRHCSGAVIGGWSLLSALSALLSRGVFQGVAMDSLKYLPFLTFLSPAGGHP